MRLQPEQPGAVQQPRRRFRRAAELVPEWRHRRRKVRCYTAFHRRAGGVLGDGRHTLLAVEREPTDPARIRPGNVGGFLDGVPERQQAAVDAGVVARVDLADRCDVECGPLCREQTQDLFGRVRFDRVADLRVGQCGAQRPEVLAHLTKIDAQIR
ncbi:hypothetical protein ATCCBAA256_21170 [Mycobacterium montefiorense]|nr:hypothetical protein ATCCBAA256_21170 [Mycobacterium montefiorense]